MEKKWNNMAICGIYQIRNKLNGKAYVGQSININDRYTKHRYELNKGSHHNAYLQRAWNKYRSESFVFEVVITCSEEELSKQEEAIVTSLGLENLYNIAQDFTSRNGEKNPFYGRKHSNAAKKKMSKWRKQHYVGENNPNYGNKQPLFLRLKMVCNNSGTKLTPDEVRKIAALLKKGLPHQEIANEFNVGRTTITRIATGERWTNVTGGPVCPVKRDENGKRQFSKLHRQRIGDKRRGQKHSEETKSIMRQKIKERKNG